MSVSGKRSLAVAVAELRLGCDLVREAHAGPTGTAAERQDPLYIWAVQHDDHSTRQKLEAGWQLGIRQEVRMICAARQLEKALQVSIADQTSNVLGLDNAGEAPTASTQKSRIDIGNGDGIRVQNAQSFGWRLGCERREVLSTSKSGGKSCTRSGVLCSFVWCCAAVGRTGSR